MKEVMEESIYCFGSVEFSDVCLLGRRCRVRSSSMGSAGWQRIITVPRQKWWMLWRKEKTILICYQTATEEGVKVSVMIDGDSSSLRHVPSDDWAWNVVLEYVRHCT